jgi:HEAT repeat protein
MAVLHRSGIETALADLFNAERTARRLIGEIAAGPADVVLSVLTNTIAASRTLADENERVFQLESVAQILGQLAGPGAVDALIDILGSEEPEARHAAGVVLEEMAFERFKEVALGIERALATLSPDHLALPELPYLLIEVPEPGVSRLIHRFLEHRSEEVVAAAIEACVELGDPTSVPKLQKLERDTRVVELDEGAEPSRERETSVTIGELAKEARLLLEELPPEERP